MSDSFLKRGNVTKNGGRGVNLGQQNNKVRRILFTAAVLIVFGSVIRLSFANPTEYAQAYSNVDIINNGRVKSPLFPKQSQVFRNEIPNTDPAITDLGSTTESTQGDSNNLANIIYDMVGESPIKEMVPFISNRNPKVAAFLVGIAKKESSLGQASPSKDGQTCYNYWGYKGEGSRGIGMGYACFATPEEAISVVGNKIEKLVDSQHDTPSRIVDTWKCGKSCAADPGAKGWVSTVALYFDRIVAST